MSVVVVGSLNRDYVCVVETLPRPGETVVGGALSVGSGGKGGNQAVAAALVGAAYDVPVVLVGAVGADADGEALLADLRAAGVDVDGVPVRAGVRTGAALITVDRAGENAIVVAPGANHAVTEASVTSSLAGLVPGDVVVVQGELTVAATVAAIRAAGVAGARAVVNLAPYADLPADVLALADPLVVNEGEAGALLDLQVKSLDEARAACEELARRALSVVLTVGKAGSLASSGESVIHVAAPELSAEEVVDTTGAGDACTGALAVALALGHDLETATRWGVAVGSASVRRAGAQASYPRGADVTALLADTSHPR